MSPQELNTWYRTLAEIGGQIDRFYALLPPIQDANPQAKPTLFVTHTFMLSATMELYNVRARAFQSSQQQVIRVATALVNLLDGVDLTLVWYMSRESFTKLLAIEWIPMQNLLMLHCCPRDHNGGKRLNLVQCNSPYPYCPPVYRSATRSRK